MGVKNYYSGRPIHIIMLIALISDTHITEKREKLSKKVPELFDGVDLIIHAGDITHQKVIDELETVAPVIAVSGNNDKLDLNETEVIDAENFKIAVNHGPSYSDDFDRLYELARKLDADILITGHTHRPHCKIIDDILFINPGSPNRPIKSDASVCILNIEKNTEVVSDIEIHFVKLT